MLLTASEVNPMLDDLVGAYVTQAEKCLVEGFFVAVDEVGIAAELQHYGVER